MKFTNFFFLFCGSLLAYWVRIHHTASLVAVVINRNVNYIRKALYIVVCSALSYHQILSRGSGSGTDPDLGTQNNTDPVGFMFGSAILQKTQRVPTLSLSMFLLTFYKVLRYRNGTYLYVPYFVTCCFVTLCDSTGTTIYRYRYTGDWYCLFFRCKYMCADIIFNPFFLLHDPENWGSVKLVVTSESVMQLNS